MLATILYANSARHTRQRAEQLIDVMIMCYSLCAIHYVLFIMCIDYYTYCVFAHVLAVFE